MILRNVSTSDLLEEITRRLDAVELTRVPAWALPTLELVAKTYNCMPSEITPDNRRNTKNIANARYLAMYLLRVTKPTYSLHVIGDIFSRDHSLVAFATKRIKELRAKNHQIDAEIAAMITKLS